MLRQLLKINELVNCEPYGKNILPFLYWGTTDDFLYIKYNLGSTVVHIFSRTENPVIYLISASQTLDSIVCEMLSSSASAKMQQIQINQVNKKPKIEYGE